MALPLALEKTSDVFSLTDAEAGAVTDCEAGVMVTEKTLTYQDFEKADEIFATGNYSKVVPVTRIGDRSLPFGPLYTKARELYWAFAHS